MSSWHPGELTLQRLVGVEDSGRLRRGVRDALPRPFQQFLAVQSMAVLASVDASGSVWASLVWGGPALDVLDEHSIRIAPGLVDRATRARLRVTPAIGLLAIDLETRQRVRVNGDASVGSAGEVIIRIREVFGNCQQYIQKRVLRPFARAPIPDPVPVAGTSLDASQQGRIARADTFFIASCHPQTGADASHRGGSPGFVQVRSPTSLVIPDYSGNNMFQTLGNIVENPRAGLLFVDFESGDLLQLSGLAFLITGAGQAGQQAERLLNFEVEQVIDRAAAVPLVWEFREYSPLNPAVG